MAKRGLTPQGYYESKYNGLVRYQSSYEHKFMQYMDDHDFNWIRCKDRFPYLDSEGKKHTYNPDFYLPKYDLYLEVKGMIRKNDPLKFAAFPDDKKLLLLGYKELTALGLKVFNPMEVKVPLSKDKWPYKLLAQMPDFAEVGVLTPELESKVSKYRYIFNL